MSNRLLFSLFFGIVIVNQISARTNVKWCVYTDEEYTKCEALKAASKTVNMMNDTLTCVRENSAPDCMNAIGKIDPTANIMRLDAGLAYYGAQLYTLRPLLAENYGDSNNGATPNRNIQFSSVVMVRRGSDVTIENMRNKRLCSGGVGTSFGWTVPLARLIQQTKTIPVEQCNSVVLSVTNYFSQLCLPGALNSLFNSFGSNSIKACSICKDKNDGNKYCKFSDNFAGSDGALRCMLENTGDVAFLRIDEALDYASSNSTQVDLSPFELLCPDGTRQLVTATGCNWGTIYSSLIVTSIRESASSILAYRNFLKRLVTYFGPSSSSTFKLFSSEGYGSNKRNLLMSDQTQMFYDADDDGSPQKRQLSTVYNWLGESYLQLHDSINYCPLSDVRWCVLSDFELEKCERMKLAFSAKNLKPSINCVQGSSAVQCMRYIQLGLADVINVDAGDLYVAGKRFGLVLFVAEFYGDSTSYHAVAIVRQTDKQTLVSNLKNKRTCHSGAGKATGWIVPINLVLDTRQITVLHCRLMHAFSELVSRACVPGIMENEHNPSGYNPINLCENCAAGGADRCRRNNRELYYGDDGAFRCLAEGAGDVAFARHTTVFDNTAGHNPAHWARNRRSDDFELLCADGSRRMAHEWANCNLGSIPGNVLVTASHKTEQQKQTMWQLLKYAQSFYASDTNGNNFHMFDSGFDRSDLMFQDIAESLIYIEPQRQNYTTWLGQEFLQKIQTLEWQSCGLYSGLALSATSVIANAAAAVAAVCAAALLPALLH